MPSAGWLTDLNARRHPCAPPLDVLLSSRRPVLDPDGAVRHIALGQNPVELPGLDAAVEAVDTAGQDD
ncbi:MAG TPA: hypothetical protein VGI58_06415, partial [Streptosporangiaceae bacterium]